MFALVVAALVAAPLAAPVIEGVKDANDVPGVRAAFDVDGDPDRVLDLLWDVDRFKSIFPDIKELTVIERGADVVVVKFDVDAVVKDVTYTLRRRLDRGRRTVSWVSVAGDVERIDGFWRVEPREGGGSKVTYQSVVDVGVPVVTAAYRGVVLNKMTQTVERVQRAAQRLPSTPPTPPSTPSTPSTSTPTATP